MKFIAWLCINIGGIDCKVPLNCVYIYYVLSECVTNEIRVWNKSDSSLLKSELNRAYYIKILFLKHHPTRIWYSKEYKHHEV
jgi:hypothetical protein